MMRVAVLLLVFVVILTGMGWNDEEYFVERNNLPKYMWPIEDIKNIPTELRNVSTILQTNDTAYYSSAAVIFGGAYMASMKGKVVPPVLKRKSPLLYELAKKGGAVNPKKPNYMTKIQVERLVKKMIQDAR